MSYPIFIGPLHSRCPPIAVLGFLSHGSVETKYARDIMYFVLLYSWESYGMGQSQIFVGLDRKNYAHGQAW